MSRLKNWMETIQVQQLLLCFLLLGGLGAYFMLSWYLRVKNYILSTDNLESLHNVAVQLFLPYLGVAFGGVFGATRIKDRQIDVYTFGIAAAAVLLWDALALGNVFLITFEVQAVEDVVKFSENTMPVLSVLVAGAIAYYFGAQSTAARGPSPRALAAPGTA